MKNEDRLIEVMAELLAEVHEMRVDMAKQFNGLQTEVKGVKSEIRTLQKQQAQTNIELSEMRLSLMKLADMSDRVIRLENEVFKKAS
jgi:septal ring factor EnvC (AmiA/AmiB activator)